MLAASLLLASSVLGASSAAADPTDGDTIARAPGLADPEGTPGLPYPDLHLEMTSKPDTGEMITIVFTVTNKGNGPSRERAAFAKRGSPALYPGPIPIFTGNVADDATENLRQYGIKALAPGESTTFTYVLPVVCNGFVVIAAVEDGRGYVDADRNSDDNGITSLVCDPIPVNRADLTVRRLDLVGPEPGVRIPCEPGNNPVGVTIRNEGSAKAPPFTIKLLVDGNSGPGLDRGASGLDPDDDVTVTFDVVLLRGAHTLTAVVTPGNTIEDENNGNNERTMNLVCRE